MRPKGNSGDDREYRDLSNDCNHISNDNDSSGSGMECRNHTDLDNRGNIITVLV